MRKNIKKNVLLSLGLLSLGALALGGVAMNDAVVANGDGVESVECFDGAKIRVVDPVGIRFGAKLSNYNETNGNTYGMLVFPEDYLTKYEVTGDYVASFAAKNVKVADMTCYVQYGDYDNDGTEENYIQGSLVGLKYANLNRAFVGVGYIKDTDGNYTYSAVSATRTISYVASAAIFDYTTEDAAYATCLKYVHSGANYANGITNEEEGYISTSDFSIIATDKLTLKPNENAAISVTQTPAMGYFVKYTSADEKVATVDAQGNVTAVAKGKTTVTVQCADKTETVEVIVDNPPALDGKIDDEQYGDDYMTYTIQYGKYTNRGTADIFVYTYAGEESVYMALDVVGPSKLGEAGKLIGSGVMMMVKNATTGEGKYLRAYANACIRSCPLSAVIENNNGYDSATNWQSPTTDPCPWYANTVTGDSDYYSQYTMEFRFDYTEFGVENANELSFVLGWISNDGWECVYGTDGTCFYANKVSDSDSTANYANTATGDSSWWTYESIVAKKAETKAIRLDGIVDFKYVNSIVYSATNSENTEDSTTTELYWYDDAEGKALFLAFEVTSTQEKTSKNTSWENTPGNAGVVFAVGKNTADSFSATWMRAYATNVSYKSMSSGTNNFYSCSNTFVDYVRGSQGALANSTRTNEIYSYVIELRLDYADYGVTSGSELSILLGGIHDHNGTKDDWQLWHYSRANGASYEFATDDATAAGQVTNVNSDYYWTLTQLETEMGKQNTTDE